jgi:hypothetical protein
MSFKNIAFGYSSAEKERSEAPDLMYLLNPPPGWR